MYCGNRNGMGAIAPIAIAADLIGGITFSRSDRYLAPGQTTKDPARGPLMGTLTTFLNRVAAGDVAVLNEWNDARKRVEGWQNAWQFELPKIPLTVQQVALVRQLDPSLRVTQIGGGASGSTPVTVTPPIIVTNPNSPSPVGSPPTAPNQTQVTTQAAGMPGWVWAAALFGALVVTGGGPKLGRRRR